MDLGLFLRVTAPFKLQVRNRDSLDSVEDQLEPDYVVATEWRITRGYCLAGEDGVPHDNHMVARASLNKGGAIATGPAEPEEV